MKWFLLMVVMLSGCVQVDDGTVFRPDKVDDTPVAFGKADKDIVAKLLAAPELQNADLLRKYSAYCKGASELMRNQKDVSLADILAGVRKSSAVFIGSKSPTLQAIAVSLLPVSAAAETDREPIAAKWEVLSVSCHAAAHAIDTRSSK